jgi:hypothetical protein
MPTVNPRITVTLTPTVAVVLRELSSLTGESQSATVAGLLEMSAPVFERVIQALKAAKAIQDHASHGVRQDIVASLDDAQARMERQLGLAIEDMDDAFLPLVQEGEKITRRAGRGAAEGDARRARAPADAPRKASSAVPTPRPVTRGSGTPERATKAGKREGVQSPKSAARGVSRGRV